MVNERLRKRNRSKDSKNNEGRKWKNWRERRKAKKRERKHVMCKTTKNAFVKYSFKWSSYKRCDLNNGHKVFRDMTPCSVTDRCQRFGESSATMYQTTRCHTPEDSNLYSHRSENLKSCTLIFNVERQNEFIWRM
jgi:hypothetical protein